jgi:hypothetical protein
MRDSFHVGSLQFSTPLVTITRHVEHRAFPPHACVCGTPALSAAARMVWLPFTSTVRWSGRKVMVGTSTTLPAGTVVRVSNLGPPSGPQAGPPPGPWYETSPPKRRFARRRSKDTGNAAAPSAAVEQWGRTPAEVHRHLSLTDLPPAVAEKVAFDESAPRRVRREKLPEEARQVFREVWDDIVADVYDEMAGRGRGQLFDKEVIARVLERVALRMQRAERALIATAVVAPLPGDRDWAHIGVAGAGAATGAAAEEVAAYISVGTGATVAVTSAIIAELFETYVAASARTRQYRRARRSPDPELIATDLAESLGYSGAIGRRTNSELTRSALGWLAHQLVTRTGRRFARGLLPVMGVAVNAGTAGRNLRRVVRTPLRDPSEQELVRQAQDLVLERDEWETNRKRFEDMQPIAE